MASIQFSIEFGDPSGTLEEMGCEGMTNARDVIRALKEDGTSVKDALDAWDMLDSGSVMVTFTPDIPEELQFKSVWKAGETIPEWTAERQEQWNKLQLWLKENQTHASWSDFGTGNDEDDFS